MHDDTLTYSLTFAALSAAAAALSWWAARRSSLASRSSLDLRGYLDAILRDYLERGFRSTPAPKIPNCGGKTYEMLRTAKADAWRFIRSKPSASHGLTIAAANGNSSKATSSCSDTRWNEWRTAADQKNYDPNYPSKGAPEAIVGIAPVIAFETAWALEQLGALCIADAVPLRMVLPNMAETLVDDWVLCEPWVTSYRAQQNIQPIQTPAPAPYHRRHGEWLALVAYFWLRQKWHYPQVDKLLAMYGNECQMQKTLQQITRADDPLVSVLLKLEVYNLTDVDVI